jgi:hypothetical protein
MLILDAVADLSEVRPLVLKTSCPTLGVFFETALTDFWIVGKIRLDIVDLLVADILLLDIAEDIVVELGIETKEHF